MQRSLLRETWAELKRRRVVRAGITYAVVGWVVLQAAEITYEPLGLPPWALTWTVLGVVLGFPVVLVLSWFFDVSTRGVTRERGVTGRAGAAFAVAMVLLAVGGVAWWLYGVYAPAKLRLADASTNADASPSAAPPNSVGVLPFDDLSPAADQGFLADGIAEELLDRLARNTGLKVASRTSSFALRGLAQDMRTLGRQLGVRWLLEGSLRKTSGRVRVTAQLIDTNSGFHVWSDTYERPDQDLFALQDEIAVAIADELSSRIEGVVAEAPAQADTDNAQALQAYLQGREAWRKRTAASLETAEAMFGKAVELDPEFARAWSGLADTYLLQADYGRRSEEDAIRLAEPAAVKAVVMRPKLGEAWASLGLLRMTAGQYKAAQSSLEQAMSLDPRYEMAPMWLANVYASIGRTDKKREVLLKAVEINPLEPVINVNLAELLANNGDPQGARDVLQRVLAITPDDASLLRSLSGIELAERNYAAAARAARSALATDPDGPANIHAMLRLLMQIEDFDAATAVRRATAGQHPGSILRTAVDRVPQRQYRAAAGDDQSDRRHRPASIQYQQQRHPDPRQHDPDARRKHREGSRMAEPGRRDTRAAREQLRADESGQSAGRGAGCARSKRRGAALERAPAACRNHDHRTRRQQCSSLHARSDGGQATRRHQGRRGGARSSLQVRLSRSLAAALRPAARTAAVHS